MLAIVSLSKIRNRLRETGFNLPKGILVGSTVGVFLLIYVTGYV